MNWFILGAEAMECSTTSRRYGKASQVCLQSPVSVSCDLNSELPKYGYKLTSESKSENFLKVAKVLKHPGEINSLAVWPK